MGFNRRDLEDDDDFNFDDDDAFDFGDDDAFDFGDSNDSDDFRFEASSSNDFDDDDLDEFDFSDEAEKIDLSDNDPPELNHNDTGKHSLTAYLEQIRVAGAKGIVWLKNIDWRLRIAVIFGLVDVILIIAVLTLMFIHFVIDSFNQVFSRVELVPVSLVVILTVAFLFQCRTSPIPTKLLVAGLGIMLTLMTSTLINWATARLSATGISPWWLVAVLLLVWVLIVIIAPPAPNRRAAQIFSADAETGLLAVVLTSPFVLLLAYQMMGGIFTSAILVVACIPVIITTAFITLVER